MSLVQRIKRFLASPQGRRLTDEGRRQLAKPENQRRLRELASRLSRRRYGSGGH